MRQAGRYTDQSRKWAKRQGQGEDSKTEWQGRASELVLVPTWIRQLPELQVDPILDLAP